jgi:hypothetical protein
VKLIILFLVRDVNDSKNIKWVGGGGTVAAKNGRCANTWVVDVGLVGGED